MTEESEVTEGSEVSVVTEVEKFIHSIDLLFKLLIKEDIHQGWK